MINSFTLQELGITNGDYLISVTIDGNELQVFAPFRAYKSNVQIDFTNDTSGSVTAGKLVKLTFDTFNSEADTANISKLSCYQS